MAYYAVDKNGEGRIHSDIPKRDNDKGVWISDMCIYIFGGNSLLGVDITWEDDPIEIITVDKKAGYIKVENVDSGNELDVIYGIKDLLTKKVRECLVKFMGEEDVKLVSFTDGNLNIPCLFGKFYLRAIIYKDESFNFLGYKENNINVPYILSEHNLPDGGLFTILEYLSIGDFEL